MKSVATFLMFVGEHAGKAESAIEFYTSLFDDSEILHIQRYGPDEAAPESMVKLGRFTINGVEFMVSENTADHEFSFTPAISLFVECETTDEQENAFGKLAEGGSTLMPLDNYGFSQQFGWVQDRFGVSWQLNVSG